MTTRRGYTLIELIVVMSTMLALLTCFTLLIGLLLRLDRAGATVVADRDTLGRLAVLFRADVRAARTARLAEAEGPPSPPKKDAAPAPGEPDLVLELPAGRTVRYHAQAGALLRVVEDRGTLKQQEAFRLPRRAAAHLGQNTRDGQQFVVLSLRPTTPPRGERQARTIDIDAALGRDHRYEAAEGR